MSSKVPGTTSLVPSLSVPTLQQTLFPPTSMSLFPREQPLPVMVPATVPWASWSQQKNLKPPPASPLHPGPGVWGPGKSGLQVTPFVTRNPSPACTDCVTLCPAGPASLSLYVLFSKEGQIVSPPPGRWQSHLAETAGPEHAVPAPAYSRCSAEAGSQSAWAAITRSRRAGALHNRRLPVTVLETRSPRSGHCTDEVWGGLLLAADGQALTVASRGLPLVCVPGERERSSSPCKDSNPVTWAPPS